MSNEIGEFIRKKRKEANMTLKQVSEKAGISYPYLSTVETGKRENPSAEVLNNIANVLGISSIEILTIAGYLTSNDTNGLSDNFNEDNKLNLLNPLEILTLLPARVVKNILRSYIEINNLDIETFEFVNVSDTSLEKFTPEEYVDLLVIKHKELLHVYVFMSAIAEFTGEDVPSVTIWKWTENLNKTAGIAEKALNFEGFVLWEKLYFTHNFLDDYGDYELQNNDGYSFDLSPLLEHDTLLFKGKILSPSVVKILRTILANA